MLAAFAFGGAFLAASALSVAAAGRSVHGQSSDAILAISTSPKLKPAFNANVQDYVVRCRKRLAIALAVGRGGTAWIDGRQIHGGQHVRSLAKRAGEATVISAQRGSTRATYHLRCLPGDFPGWHVRRSRTPQAGWYLATIGRFFEAGAYDAIFDSRGVPVWWMRGGDRGVTLLSRGRFAWNHYGDAKFGDRRAPFRIETLDGRAAGHVRPVRAATDDHELRELPNGDFLLLGTRTRKDVDLRPFGGPRKATVLDGVVQEVRPNGHLVWEWSTHNHVALAETGRWFKLKVLPQPEPLADGSVGYDIVHLNSIDPHGDHLLVSARHTDAVYDIDRATGRVEWKLGGTRTARSLAVPGRDASTLFGGQHDARVLPDGTVTVHDNGSAWRRPPRALRLRIDTQRMTASVLEDVERHGSALSDCCGSARKLPGGHWVVSWGALNDFEELTASGRRVLRVSFQPGYYSYRVIPYPLGALSIKTLRSAMDAAARRQAR